MPGGSSIGDRFEVYIPWAQLGVPAGTPIYYHVSSSTNGNFSSGLDNLGGPDGKLGSFGVFAVGLAPDRTASTASPGTVNYCHTVTNTGAVP